MSHLISQILIEEPKHIDRCLIAIPGRGGSADIMQQFCKAVDLPDTMVVALEARYYAWYHQPNSPQDQDKAVSGLPAAINELSNLIMKIKNGWNLDDEQIILCGHSAGAVIAIQTAIHSMFNLKACISLAGAILVPNEVPKCSKNTKFLLQHNTNDDCFTWDERYLPMENALESNNYDIQKLIGDGSHNSFTWRIASGAKDFLNQIFNLTSDEPNQFSDKDEQETSDH